MLRVIRTSTENDASNGLKMAWYIDGMQIGVFAILVIIIRCPLNE